MMPYRPLAAFAVAAALVTGGAWVSAPSAAREAARVADTFELDPVHTAVIFEIEWADMTPFYGRFNATSGTIEYDGEDVSTFRADLEIAVDSVDTHNEQRDRHLKSPDFFNAREHPTIRFVSERLEATSGGYDLTGELTIRGTTQPVVAKVTQLSTKDTPRGFRCGFAAEFEVNRSDFGVDFMLGEGLGDTVKVRIGLQSVRQ